MEELEANASLPQDLIEWYENDVAHTGPHFPKKGAAIGEEHAQRAAQRLTRGERRPLRIGIFVSKRQVVKAGHEGRVERPFRRAIHPQPLATFVVVDGAQAPRIKEQTKAYGAHQNGE